MKLTREELLVLLIEECGEVIQAATKCLRFGYAVDHGTGYGMNVEALAKELGELAAVQDELPLSGHCRAILARARDGKIERAEAAKEKYGVPQSTTRQG